MVTIFIEDKPLYLAKDMQQLPAHVANKPGTVYYVNPKTAIIKQVIEDMQSGKSVMAILLDADFDKLCKRVFKQFKVMVAAGGIVQNAEKDLLFILRRGKWDLPKGKLDKGEEPEACAIREIEEETGAKNLTLKKKIGETYHTYSIKGKQVLKMTHWFYFISKGRQNLVPQIEEDIEDIKWFSTKDIKTPVANTYPNIKIILSEFFDTP